MNATNGHSHGLEQWHPNGPESAVPSALSNTSTATQFTRERIKVLVSELGVPFDPSVIEWRITNTTKGKGTPRGQVIPYADQRAYTDRLNALSTPSGWTRKYTVHTSANFQRSNLSQGIVYLKVSLCLSLHMSVMKSRLLPRTAN
jgi:hypothetical protein